MKRPRIASKARSCLDLLYVLSNFNAMAFTTFFFNSLPLFAKIWYLNGVLFTSAGRAKILPCDSSPSLSDERWSAGIANMTV